MRFRFKYLVFGAIGYVALVSLVFMFQQNIVFFPDKTPFNDCPELLFDGGKALEFPETRLYEVRSRHPEPKGWILYYHGNGGRACDRYPFFKEFLKRGFHLAMVEYPGYAETGSLPTEKELLQSALVGLNIVLERKPIAEKLIVYGESLGTTVATYVVSQKPSEISGLILQAPFSSVSEIGRHHYFFLPVKFMSRYRFSAEHWAKKIDVPVFAFHGTEDRIVPISFGMKQVSHFMSTEVKFLRILGAGHGNILIKVDENFWRHLDDFLNGI